jgi:hypothetical protein
MTVINPQVREIFAPGVYDILIQDNFRPLEGFQEIERYASHVSRRPAEVEPASASTSLGEGNVTIIHNYAQPSFWSLFQPTPHYTFNLNSHNVTNESTQTQENKGNKGMSTQTKTAVFIGSVILAFIAKCTLDRYQQKNGLYRKMSSLIRKLDAKIYDEGTRASDNLQRPQILQEASGIVKDYEALAKFAEPSLLKRTFKSLSAAACLGIISSLTGSTLLLKVALAVMVLPPVIGLIQYANQIFNQEEEIAAENLVRRVRRFLYVPAPSAPPAAPAPRDDQKVYG